MPHNKHPQSPVWTHTEVDILWVRAAPRAGSVSRPHCWRPLSTSPHGHLGPRARGLPRLRPGGTATWCGFPCRAGEGMGMQEPRSPPPQPPAAALPSQVGSSPGSLGSSLFSDPAGVCLGLAAARASLVQSVGPCAPRRHRLCFISLRGKRAHFDAALPVCPPSPRLLVSTQASCPQASPPHTPSLPPDLRVLTGSQHRPPVPSGRCPAGLAPEALLWCLVISSVSREELGC